MRRGNQALYKAVSSTYKFLGLFDIVMYHPTKSAMRSSLNLLPLLGGFYSLTEAKPLDRPSVTFRSPSQISTGSAHNIIIAYDANADGELTITYGSCDGAAVVSDAKQLVGTTHVGNHPLAARHVDHGGRWPTKFVWVTPTDTTGGCLHAFLDGELVGQSEDLAVAKRVARRSAKRSFVEVAGDDSMWFNGVAYLEQKEPDESFVAAAKNKSFGIIGAGMSGLMSSVSLRLPVLIYLYALSLTVRIIATVRLRWYPQLEDLGVV